MTIPAQVCHDHTKRRVRDGIGDVFAVVRPSRYLMSIVAYFDESADVNRERVFALGSIVAHEQFWREFVARMRVRLDSDGIGVFHATDCESCWGEFRKWQTDKQKSIQLMTDLITLILDSQLVCFWSGMLMADYNAIVKGNVPPMIDDPYFICLIHCLKQILPGMIGTPREEMLGFVFEENAEVQHSVLLMVKMARESALLPLEERERIGIPAFAPKDSTCALQAADLLAYECFKHVDNLLFSSRPERKSIARLKARLVRGVHLDATFLKLFMTQWRTFEAGLSQGIPQINIDHTF